MKVKGEKKLLKKKVEVAKVEAKREEKKNVATTETRKGILRDLINGQILSVKGDEFTLFGFESVAMPQLLVDRFIDFIQLKRDVEPLVNFWMLCLLNPNKIARYKLFAYLSKHRLIITPSGYFVTYRMVKETSTSKEDGIYVDAHTGKFQHIIGKVSRMYRKDCDEDGNADCSRGLHSGSPDFIGIKLGDGYNKGEVKVKSQGGGYGTGYDHPSETTQKFDHSHGNQAVICIVNPMHVVSIPNSDTRKMRSSEIFIAKLTTPEEVLSHLTEADYLIFDSEYAGLEAYQLKEQLKDAKLEDYSDGSVEKLSKEKGTPAKNKLKALTDKLNAFSTKILDDKPADDVTQEEMMRVVASRVKHIDKFYERPVLERMDVTGNTEGKKAISNLLGEVGKLAKNLIKGTPNKLKEKVAKSIEIAKEVKKDYDKSIAKDELQKQSSTNSKKAPSKVGKEEVAKQKEVSPKTTTNLANKKDGKSKVAEAVSPKLAKELQAIKQFVITEWEKVKKAKKSPKNFWIFQGDNNALKKVELAKGEIPTTDKGTVLLGNLDDLYNKNK